MIRIACILSVLAAGVAGASPEQARLQGYFDCFADVAEQCPTELQRDLVGLVGKLWRHITAKEGRREGTPEALLEEAEEMYQRLSGVLVVEKAVWKDGALTWAEPPAALPVAKGLTRHIIVEVTNSSDAPMVLPALGGRPVPPALGTTAPGEMRPRLVPVLAEDLSAKSIELGLSVSGTAVSLTLPVSVSESARMTGVVANDGKVFPARIYARGSDGILRHGEAYRDIKTVSEKQILEAPGSNRNQKLPFFYSDGRFAVVLPPGTAEVTMERGFEDGRCAVSTELKPGEDRLPMTLGAGPMVDMRAKGWISGDTHVHWAKNWWNEDEDIELLGVVQRAENIRVVNNLTLRHQNVGQPEFIAPAQFPMGPVPGHVDADYMIIMGEEYRNQPYYGHLNFLNVKELIQPISTGDLMTEAALDYPLNRTALIECYRQGGISCEAHGLAGEGAANVIDGFATLLDQTDPDDYYRVLNAGMRIGLGNGSDHPARVTGCARLYVRVEGEFTYAAWIEGCRKGRTFTTSGPLLFLDVNGTDIGDELRVDSGAPLTVTARAIARDPIGTLQVVVNGEVVREVKTSNTKAELSFEIPAEESLWVAARCSRAPYYNALYGPDVAHTSAVYVVVDGKPIFQPAAAQSLAQQLRNQAKYTGETANFENDTQRQEAMKVMLDAAEKYEALVAK